MCDIDGLLTTTRKDGNLDGHKKHYAKDHQPIKDLGQIVREIKPTVVSAHSNALALFINLIVFPSADFNRCIRNARSLHAPNPTRYGQE